MTTVHASFGTEAIVHIGGTVVDGGGNPVEGAWVRLDDATGNVRIQAAETDEAGRYRLHGLTEGSYLISAGSAMVGGLSPPASIVVPDPLGSYDLTLT